MGQLLAACVVRRLHDDPGKVGTTAIDKGPVEGPVKVGTLGLYADVQADRRHHGGESQAVYAYADEDAAWWASELGRDIPPGYFGENIRVAGLEVSNAIVGTRWLIGGSVELEVTKPRTPCMTFARWIGEDGWVRRFSDARRLGTYLRVVRTGSISAGDAVEVVHIPEGAPTILDLYDGVKG
ncbi:MOSC domain-containing protein [Brooklawnia cerclae]|uniref:MOSC domain-containing protein YiiM n=1 Tax=Brooklawnia cerclae TaxID=349934 RepID=A0ABX0SE70_9ACTN|nr:MOSC domain-containing protein [Brooklawnia cerclae]NIH56687.1 MOSC domain-containing protein YiiM [Brooklawnia cerclae]